MSSISRSRIGLALGSGAALGWAHIGVLRALDEIGVVPDVVAGTSSGGLIGGFYLKGSVAKIEAWARRLSKFRMVRYVNFGFRGTGLIAGDRLFGEMEEELGDTIIENLDKPFATIATDLHTGHEVWLTEGGLVEAIRASFSLPGFFEPMKIEGRWLIDGALVNPVPVSVCRALGARVVIAVNLNEGGLTQKYELGNGVFSGVGFDSFAHFGAARDGDGKIDPAPDAPSLVSVMAGTLNIVQDRIARSRLASDPPELIIAPQIGHIGMLDFHRASELIDAGYKAVDGVRDLLRSMVPAMQATRT
jgi:NTE family protein